MCAMADSYVPRTDKDPLFFYLRQACIGMGWCNVLQCVVVCCSVLQSVAVCCSVLQTGIEDRRV